MSSKRPASRSMTLTCPTAPSPTKQRSNSSKRTNRKRTTEFGMTRSASDLTVPAQCLREPSFSVTISLLSDSREIENLLSLKANITS